MTEPRRQSPRDDFIMLADGSFGLFSVNDGKTEIKAPFESLHINVSLKLNGNIPRKGLVTVAALAATAPVWLGLTPRAYAKTAALSSAQHPQIAYVSETGLQKKSTRTTSSSNWSQNASISNLATTEKVDSNSTYSSAEETSLNVVNPKSKKSSFISI